MSMQQILESELAESAETLTKRYHRTAAQLSSSFTPGAGGIAQVQQLFLTANWLKNETLLVESWHALSCAIREAQELGIIIVFWKISWLKIMLANFFHS